MNQPNQMVVPLCTPFTDDGLTISEVRTARLVRWYRTKGQTRFMVAGETGEYTVLSPSERKSLVEIVGRELNGGDLLVNVSATSTSSALDLAQHAARHGATAVLASVPGFPRLDEEESATYLQAIANYAKLPLIVADPNRLLGPSVLARLESIPRLLHATHRGNGLDDFAAGHWLCSTSLALLPDRPSTRLIEFLKFAPKAKSVKAGLDYQGLELGAPRAPQRRLQGDSLQKLKELLEPPLDTRLPA